MPDLPAVPDRADRVRARVDAGRRRRAVAGVVATVLVLTGHSARVAEPRLNEFCTLVARPWCRLAFNLDGRPSESVDLDMNCGLAWSDVDVEGGDLTVPLDAFAELYRAQGVHLGLTPRW